MRKITALFMASTLLLGTVQLASAADTVATKEAPPKGEMMHHKRGPMMDPMFKGLELTKEQRQKMQEISRDAMKNMKKPTAAERQQLHDVVAAESFDAAKAQALVTTMSQTQSERILARLETQNKIYNLLTAEQKKAFDKKFQEHSEKMEHHDNN